MSKTHYKVSLFTILLAFLSIPITVYSNIPSKPNLLSNSSKLILNTSQQRPKYDIHFIDVEFANADKLGREIDLFGYPLFTDMCYLTPKLFFSYHNPTANNVHVSLSYNIIRPDGTIIKNNSSNRYTLTKDIVLKALSRENVQLKFTGWGNVAGTVYKVPGTYRFDIWIDGEKLYATTFEVRDASETNLQVDVKDVQFANVYGSRIKDNYGSMLYTDMTYLKPKIYFDYKKSTKRDLKIDVSYILVDPNGVVCKKYNSEKYSASTELVLLSAQAKNQVLDLPEWGGKVVGAFKESGNYRFELWVEGKQLYTTNINVRDANAEPNIQIQKVEFANVSKNGSTIDKYGSTLYTNTLFLNPKIYFDYENSDSKDVKVNLAYKIIRPNGESIITTGMGDYSYSREFTLKARGRHNEDLELVGLGNADGTFYNTSGDYKFEIWIDGVKIHSSNINIKAKK